jgi:chemotaxis protein methyltransferase CheR
MAAALARGRADEIAVGGEFALTWRDFNTVAQLLFEMSGIRLTEAKASLVYSRLAKRVRALQLGDFSAYCDHVLGGAGADERRELLNALTTNVTAFFREPHHFRDLADGEAEKLRQVATSGGRVRLWSAGCSAGHEPYSAAMALLSVFPDAARYDVRILATDIDTQVIRRASEGLYSDADVDPVPSAFKSRWLNRVEDGWSVAREVRELIAFRPLNLLGDWPMKGRFDVIFCRNVAIYFDEPTQAALFSRFRDSLNDGGRLYIGHSERADIAGLKPDGLTAYRREGR